jgi:N-acetylglutamate synthase/N-acetylornithine aminotransferase
MGIENGKEKGVQKLVMLKTKILARAEVWVGALVLIVLDCQLSFIYVNINSYYCKFYCIFFVKLFLYFSLF